MANDEQDLELDVGEEGESASGGKSKMLIIIIAVVVLLGGGAAAFLLLGGDDKAEKSAGADGGTEGDSAKVEVVDENKEPAQYIGVPNAIVSNIPGKTRNRTVQIKMNFMVRGDEAKAAVKMHMPQLKNDVLMLVSQQSADELQTPEGRVLLQQKSLEVVQASLTDLVGKPMVEKVLFVSFVMQ